MKIIKKPLKMIKRAIDKGFLKVFSLVAPNKTKEYYELKYWKSAYKKEGGSFSNSYYKTTMLAMAQRDDDKFMEGKIVADFGCGPRGSLCWAGSAKQRIGIDVLADAYTCFGTASHNIDYVKSTEHTIPLPSSSVDVLFTMNAMDHTRNFQTMCNEVLRIIAKDGELIASFNIDESPNVCEPQTLTEEMVKRYLLDNFEIISYRKAARSDDGKSTYHHFYDETDKPISGPYFLWVRAKKIAIQFQGQEN